MSEKVYQAFLRVRDKRKRVMPVIVEGYTDFLFLKSDGCPKTAHNYTVIFHQLAEKYNKCHETPLPKKFSAHVLRHTFCTGLANVGINPKALQYIHGARKHYHDAELLRTCFIRFCKGGDAVFGGVG